MARSNPLKPLVFEAPGRGFGSMGAARRDGEVNFWREFWDSPKRLRLCTHALLGAALLLALAAGLSAALRHALLDFRAIALPQAPKHAKVTSLGRALAPLRGNFFTLDLEEARTALEKVAWVRRAAIERQWPGTLVLHLEEHKPFARWNDNELINTQHEIFRAKYDGYLPELSGPETSEALVLEQLRKLSDALKPVELRPLELHLSSRYAWQAVLSNGLVLELGRSDLPERIATFVAAYRAGLERIANAGTVIDLRYNNGLALVPVALLDPSQEEAR